MGLIDDVRKRRDSWIKRFEEQRQEEEHDPGSNADPETEEKKIMENRKKVGFYPKKNHDK